MSIDLCVSDFRSHDFSVRGRAWKTTQTEGGHDMVIYIYGLLYIYVYIYVYICISPFSLHTTFQYEGAPGKRHRLREAMLW